MLGLHGYTGAFSYCGKWGLLPSCGMLTFHFGGFSCGVQALGLMGSAVVVHDPLAVPWHVTLPDQGSNSCLLHCKVDS